MVIKMEKRMEEKKKKIILRSFAALIVLILIVALLNMNSNGRKLNELLDLGEKYLDDMAYEDAILVFDQAITIDPKCEQAYMGKAEAQYALGQYEAAMDTLRNGIENVEDSTRLEEFLQLILDEISARGEAEQNEVETEEAMDAPLRLNYSKIVRRTDTEEPEIQLEILDDTGEGEYIWESSNPDCVTVSETGLVTCLPMEGSGYVYVKDESGREDMCEINIVGPESDKEESEDFRIFDENEEGQKTYYKIHLSEEEGQKKAGITYEYSFDKYVYYSGNVIIPERFNYKNEEIPITSISMDTFFWSDELESIFIPDSIESMEGYGNPFYYCLGLKKIIVNDKNEFLKSVDGVLYSKDGKELISYPAAKEGDVYTIPKEVEKIYEGAFVGCKNLEKILVENDNECYNSIDGVLTDKNQLLVAYPAGKKESKYVIPDNITGICYNAFYMSELEEIALNMVESIETSNLSKSSKLKKIEGGNETKSIEINTNKLDNGGIVEIIELDSMDSLEQLIVQFDEEYDASTIIDFNTVSGLGNLRYLSIRRINELSDISWLENLQMLESIVLSANVITITDFSLLFDLPNLRNISISNCSENLELKKWFEEMAEEHPDMNIYYYEYNEEYDEGV